MSRFVAAFVALMIACCLFTSCQSGNHKADSHQFRAQQSAQEQQAANSASGKYAATGSETFYPKQP
mgnify:CR=1 FL=1